MLADGCGCLLALVEHHWCLLTLAGGERVLALASRERVLV